METGGDYGVTGLRNLLDGIFCAEVLESRSSAILCVILAGAAWTDFRCGKVRNWWLLLGITFGIWCRRAEFFLAAGMMLVPVWFLFRFRLTGAGDGKLMMLIAGYLGFWKGLSAIWFGLLIGAVWSICRFWHDGSFRARLMYLSAYFMRSISEQNVIAYEDFSGKGGRHRIPLAVCLAAGAYVYLMIM